MAQRSAERLRQFLAQLPLHSQAMLAQEFERALESGRDIEIAKFVLQELQQVSVKSERPIQHVPHPEQQDISVVPAQTPLPSKLRDGTGTAESDEYLPEVEVAVKYLFGCLQPYLTDNNGHTRPGQIRRSSLPQIWHWILREGAPVSAREFCEAIRDADQVGDHHLIDRASRNLQRQVAQLIVDAITSGRAGVNGRDIIRSASAHIGEDMIVVGYAFFARGPLEAFAAKLPRTIKSLGPTQLATVTTALANPQLAMPQVLPLAISLLQHGMAEPWQIARLAVNMAGSDDEVQVSSTPFGVAVTMAIHDLAVQANSLSHDIGHVQLNSLINVLKLVHDGLRGLRTEVAFRNDSIWGRRLSAIRVEVSSVLQSRIASVPAKAGRILRPRSEKDLRDAALDQLEVNEVAALISFVSICRNYAGELAVSEVTLRAFSELQQLVEKSTETLVQSLRIAGAGARDFRLAQIQAAIRFSQIIFGDEYANLTKRVVDNALSGMSQSSTRVS